MENLPIYSSPGQPSTKTFTPRFVALLVVILILGGIASVAIWMWSDKTAPVSTPTVEGQFCGGIGAIKCPSGYSCKLDGNYPDAGGKCEKDSVICTQEVKQCPNGSYVGRTGPNCEFAPCP